MQLFCEFRRVSLRRCRSLVRVYKPWFRDALPGKRRRRLKKIVATTGSARDTEVQLVWLQGCREKLRAEDQPGYQWLTETLRKNLEAEYQLLRSDLPARFRRERKHLHLRLVSDSGPATPLLGEVTAPLLEANADQFRSWLERVRGPTGDDAIHQARITGKRLRYLLEPLAPGLSGGKELARELKNLQDLMGEIHDAQVLAGELPGQAERAGAQRARRRVEASLGLPRNDPALEAEHRTDEVTGLCALATRLSEEKRGLLAQLYERTAESRVAALHGQLHEAAEQLRSAAGKG
ncbi:CHAD domain-containing protein [Thioalkalivibrio sp. ALE11]|uniref:CHAD domain-containing protein n=1 Tax=Thioalkalivibrio sp. ALE11 TaxID=1265494 RepID=UPI00210175FE|nr:CHAD domain-containing protein [Thioalkalivibrio sp. ALE11]